MASPAATITPRKSQSAAAEATTTTTSSKGAKPTAAKSNDGVVSWWWRVISNMIMMAMWLRVVIQIGVRLTTVTIFIIGSSSNSSSAATACEAIVPHTAQALIVVSFLELFNCAVGVTKSNIIQIGLFSSVRCLVAFYFAPVLLSLTTTNDDEAAAVSSAVAAICPHDIIPWQYLWTVTCWSIGDAVRFACFLLDEMLKNKNGDAVNQSVATTKETASAATNPNQLPMRQRIKDTFQRFIEPKAIRYTVGPILFPLGASGEMVMVLSIAYHHDSRPFFYTFLALLWPIGFYPLMRQLLKQRTKYFKQQQHRAKHIKSV